MTLWQILPTPLSNPASKLELSTSRHVNLCRYLSSLFHRDLCYTFPVSGAPEGVKHTLPAKNFGQRTIMPILAAAPLPEFAGALAAAPLPEFAGAAVLLTTITHCRYG